MEFSIVDFTYISNLNIDIELKNEIEKDKIYINNFDGGLFKLKKGETLIIGSFFYGINEFTDEDEQYLKLYIGEDIIEFSMIYDLIDLLEKNEVDIDLFENVYLTLNLKNRVLTEAFMDKDFKIRNYELNVVEISKEIKVESNNSFILNDEFKIMFDTNEYENEIRECLFVAYTNGLSKEKKKNLDFNTFRENIDNYYTPLLNDQRHSFVLLKGDTFIGHGTIEILLENENQKSIKIIDILINEPFVGMGLSRRILKEIERYCKLNNYFKMYGTINVEGKETFFKLYNSLENNNWKVCSLIYKRNGGVVRG